KFMFSPLRITHVAKSWNDLYNENIFDHYKIQVLNQIYVLILGLDVLGNPFGLVTDFSKGLTDLFYEPLLDYFSAEERKNYFNLGNKIKNTINNTIISAASSASLI